MSVFDPPLASGFGSGKRFSGITANFEGLSDLERERAAMDAIFERSLLAASDSSTLPLNLTPINPAAIALFGAPGNSGLGLFQLKRRSETAIVIPVTGGFGAPLVETAIETPFLGNAVPVVIGTEVEYDNPESEIDVEQPVLAWRKNTTTPEGLYTRIQTPNLTEPDEFLSIRFRVFCWEYGAVGSGFTGVPVAVTPSFDAVPDAEIAGDTKYLAQLLRKFRNRLDHLWGILNGQPDAPRIPAQAIPEQASGSGQGLVVRQMKYRFFTFPGVVLAGSGAFTVLDTGQLSSNTLARLAPTLHTITGTNYDLRAVYVTIPVGGVPHIAVRVTNLGSASATFSCDVWLQETN